MAKKGQKSVTLKDTTLELLDPVVGRETGKKYATLVKLLIEESFGSKEEQKIAKQILDPIRERNN